MARQDINTEFNTFVGGILTEANPINYPNGFTLDEENFLLERNGTRRRRLGLEVQGSKFSGKSFDDIYLWQNAAQSGSDIYDILVAWNNAGIGTNYNSLYFFLLDDETDPFSNLITTVNQDEPVVSVAAHYRTLYVSHDTNALTFALPVTGNLSRNTFLVSAYTATTSAATAVETGRLQVRDFPGYLKSDYTERNATLTDIREYNLLNIGWTETNMDQFNTDIAVYPSVRDSMNSGLDAETGAFTSSWVDLANNGTGVVTGGSRIIDLPNYTVSRAFDYETVTSTGVTTLPTTNNAAQTVKAMASFAGRMFYLIDSPESEFGNTVLAFSQVIDEPATGFDCYQMNDPNARDTNILLDTDGGLIDLTQVGKPLDMVVLNSRLIIFGIDGVFEVFSFGNVFRPADIGVRKLSEIVLTGKPTIAEDNIFFFGNGGGYTITYNPSSEEFQVVNITDRNIQSLVNAIPLADKETIKSIYVPTDKTVRFMYDETGLTGKMELILDIPLNAWYQNKFETTDMDLQEYLYVDSFQDTNLTYPTDSRLYYLGIGSRALAVPETASMNLANYDSSSFKDYDGDADGDVETQAFMQTGYINAGDSQRYKQADYIIPSFIRTEDGFTDDGNGNLTPNNESSCNITAYWDYADTTAGGKIGTAFEGYRYNRLYIPSGPADTYDYGQSVITTKNKLLGRGRALSLRFESSAGKDCRLLGWGLGFEINQRV